MPQQYQGSVKCCLVKKTSNGNLWKLISVSSFLCPNNSFSGIHWVMMRSFVSAMIFLRLIEWYDAVTWGNPDSFQSRATDSCLIILLWILLFFFLSIYFSACRFVKRVRRALTLHFVLSLCFVIKNIEVVVNKFLRLWCVFVNNYCLSALGKNIRACVFRSFLRSFSKRSKKTDEKWCQELWWKEREND